MNEIVIDIKELTKRFGDFVAVDQLSLKIKKGSIYGLLGPNGAGKSTTIRMLCGVLTPTSGKGMVIGKDIYKDTESIKQNIGYMSQKFSLYEDLTVLENLKFYASIYNIPKEVQKERIDSILKMAGLTGKEKSMTKNLSGGWKQRLSLGCSLIHIPKLLILDEPTSAVDPVSRRVFWEMIYKLAKEGITILVSTHYMDEAESCDEVAFMFGGKIIGRGSPRKMIQDKKAKNLEDVFIHYVEEQTGKKVQSSFDEMKFIHQKERKNTYE